MYKVVVVEDEKRVRQGIVMGTDWPKIDCAVVGEAGNGEAGIEVIRKCRPDIVITDIRMPKMTGLEMIQKIQEDELEPCVIFLTAYEDFAYAQQALKLGAVDYLLKPFKDGQLEDAVLNVIMKNRREAERREQQSKALRSGICDELGGEIHSGGQSELYPGRSGKSKYITDAITYVEQNYANPNISVGDVAESLGISEGHLSFLFRKETDSTLMAYVTKCRMRAAMNMLKDYRCKVYEAAEQAGYRDITYFSKTFKKYVGISPSEYQKRYSSE